MANTYDHDHHAWLESLVEERHRFSDHSDITTRDPCDILMMIESTADDDEREVLQSLFQFHSKAFN